MFTSACPKCSCWYAETRDIGTRTKLVRQLSDELKNHNVIITVLSLRTRLWDVWISINVAGTNPCLYGNTWDFCQKAQDKAIQIIQKGIGILLEAESQETSESGC